MTWFGWFLIAVETWGLWQMMARPDWSDDKKAVALLVYVLLILGFLFIGTGSLNA